VLRDGDNAQAPPARLPKDCLDSHHFDGSLRSTLQLWAHSLEPPPHTKTRTAAVVFWWGGAYPTVSATPLTRQRQECRRPPLGYICYTLGFSCSQF